MDSVKRELKDYIWRHDVDKELFTLLNKKTGEKFTVDRVRRYSLQRAIVSANQRERVKRKKK